MGVYQKKREATITNDEILQALMFGKEVVLDSEAGVPGTDFPTGTRFRPVDNLADALTICSTRGLVRIMTRTGFTVEASHNISGIVIATHGIMGTNIAFEEGCSANKATIRFANISGVITLGDVLFVESCSVGELENFMGIMNLATFGAGCEISLGEWANFINCHCGGEPTNEPELSIGTAALTLVGYSGNLKLTNKTGDNRTVANFASGNVSVASSCVAGKIQILGLGEVEKDESGPNCKVDIDAAITNEHIADHVWDETTLGHLAAGSFGEQLNFVHSVEGGRWHIINNQMVFYADDNVTEVARFDLLDASGASTETNILERRRT